MSRAWANDEGVVVLQRQRVAIGGADCDAVLQGGGVAVSGRVPDNGGGLTRGGRAVQIADRWESFRDG